MKIMTLNIKKFELDLDNNLNEFILEYDPDFIVIQEIRFAQVTNINEYLYVPPHNYNFYEWVDGRESLTVFFYKKNYICEQMKKDINLGKLNRSFVCSQVVENSDNLLRKKWSILGIHMPLYTCDNANEYYEMTKAIKESECDIICGDFNANFKKIGNSNCKMIMEITDKSFENYYKNLWEFGIKEEKAFYVNYKGLKIKADFKQKKVYRTYAGNTHVDYILGRGVKLNEILIDMRTLCFTDHCALILDFD